MNLMEFMTAWTIKRYMAGSRFSSHHPQHSTHTIHRRKSRAVVTVIGARLPDTRDSRIPVDQVLSFRRRISVLFRPFRRGQDVHSRTGTLDEGFTSWRKSPIAKGAQTYVKNNNVYYVSREMARDNQSDPEVARYFNYVSSINDTHIGDLET